MAACIFKVLKLIVESPLLSPGNRAPDWLGYLLITQRRADVS